MEAPTPKPDNRNHVPAAGETIHSKRPLRYSPAGFFRILLSLLLGVVIFIPLLTAVGIFGYQVYSWAKHGSWFVFTFAQFASMVGLPPASSLSPVSWVGITKTVQTIFRLPAALVLFVFSVSVAVLGGIFQRR
jgi:hypothetical protein